MVKKVTQAPATAAPPVDVDLDIAAAAQEAVAPPAPATRARALVAIHRHNVPAGAVFEAAAGLIAGLVSVGQADDHAEAVEAALASGAKVVVVSVEGDQ